jgi:hypothetical protein
MLRKEMERLVQRCHQLHKVQGVEDHLELCQTLAEMFDLWEDDSFPIWLSRVVEGVMRDGPHDPV